MAEAWDRFLKHAAYVRGNPLFESEERRPSLEIAAGVRHLLEAARAGGALRPHLEALFTLLSDPGRAYFVISLPERDWLEAWASSDEASLRQALVRFLDAGPDPEARFDAFTQAVRKAKAEGAIEQRGGAAMAFGSLLNFAVAPELLPVVRVNPYRELERMLSYDFSSEGSITDRYRSHLAFARQIEAALQRAGIPIRDMVDVQGLIFTAAVAQMRNELWTDGAPSRPDELDDPAGDGSRERTASRSPYLSVCSCLGYDTPYLVEWLEFHRLVGVERFFLYNNGDREAQRDLLAPYVEEGVVVLYHWPEFPPQVPAFRHCLETHRDDSRWIAFFDTDEFLFSPTGRSLPELLQEYEQWPGIGVSIVVFGPSGHRDKPAGLVAESYLQRLRNRHIKSIVDPRRAIDCATPHHFVYERGFAVDENRYPIPGARTTFVSFSRLRINHYYTKSEAEFREKWARHRPDTGSEREKHEFAETVDSVTRFGQTDREILQYVSRLRDSVERASG